MNFAVKALIVLCSFYSVAHANDGGIAAIKVSQIKMKETAIKDGKEVIVRKIVKPSFTITLKGEEASKLQKILPSQVSVLTAMKPELAALYNESFKALGIYSDKSAEASAKALTIDCNDAKLTGPSYDQIVKTGETVCTITISGNENGEAVDGFGDAQTFEPKTCK